jgi:hypothetical protein
MGENDARSDEFHRNHGLPMVQLALPGEGTARFSRWKIDSLPRCHHDFEIRIVHPSRVEEAAMERSL